MTQSCQMDPSSIRFLADWAVADMVLGMEDERKRKYHLKLNQSEEIDKTIKTSDAIQRHLLSVFSPSSPSSLL